MKKGFTLIELLVTLAILSLITTLIVINVNYFLNIHKERDYNDIVTIIEKNTEILINTDDSVYKKVNNKLSTVNICKISYLQLVNNKLMDSDTINPKTNQLINTQSYIKVTVDSNYNYNFEFFDKDINNNVENIQDCLN